MDKMLTGKSAIVTGGTRGIGYAIVRKLLQGGFRKNRYSGEQCRNIPEHIPV